MLGDYGVDSMKLCFLHLMPLRLRTLQLEKKVVPKDNQNVPTYLKRLNRIMLVFIKF